MRLLVSGRGSEGFLWRLEEKHGQWGKGERDREGPILEGHRLCLYSTEVALSAPTIFPAIALWSIAVLSLKKTLHGPAIMLDHRRVDLQAKTGALG